MKLSLNRIVFYSREVSLDWFAFFHSAFPNGELRH